MVLIGGHNKVNVLSSSSSSSPPTIDPGAGAGTVSTIDGSEPGSDVGPNDGSGGVGGGGGGSNKILDGPYGAGMKNTHLDTTTSGHSMLESSRVQTMNPYFNYSTVASHAIQEFFEGKVRGKINSETIFYDNMLLYFFYFFVARNLLLTFIEYQYIRGWLGETERVRPQRQLVMVFTILSVYVACSMTTLTGALKTKYKLSWLEPFQVLRGESTPQSYGLSSEMMTTWYNITLSFWRRYFIFSHLVVLTVLLYFIGLVRHRWNIYPGDEQEKLWFNVMSIIWAIINVLWSYLSSMNLYVCFVYFNSLCYYFRIRFMKVNNDIETIITQRLKANERVALLHHILVEHNELCLKVAEFNKFWAKYMMATYFFLFTIICFTLFQAFFTANLIYIRLVMIIFASFAAFLITRSSISASVLSKMAHHPYRRLIRVSFEKYPVELQIQLRMLIQRTSGPTIGFYCLDVFEITYTTYASILAALGQNFLLIVDFVRSYAEVGKEYSELSFDQLEQFSETMFNATLDVVDEMTGSHLAQTLHHSGSGSGGNHSLMNLIAK